jgi:hypothetical protein
MVRESSTTKEEATTCEGDSRGEETDTTGKPTPEARSWRLVLCKVHEGDLGRRETGPKEKITAML